MTARARKRWPQSSVRDVPHHNEKRGTRGARAKSYRRGQWLMSTVRVADGSASRRTSVASQRAWHHASREDQGAGESASSSPETHPVFTGPSNRVRRGDVWRPERIVEEQEHWHDDRVWFGRPPFVRIVRGEYAELPADADQFIVACLSARACGFVGRAPQVVIARRPDHAREARSQDLECECQVLGSFADVSGHDEPVVGMGRDCGQGLAVDPVPHVQVADGE